MAFFPIGPPGMVQDRFPGVAMPQQQAAFILADMILGEIRKGGTDLNSQHFMVTLYDYIWGFMIFLGTIYDYTMIMWIYDSNGLVLLGTS